MGNFNQNRLNLGRKALPCHKRRRKGLPAKPALKSLRNKADKLLQIYTRLRYAGVMCYGCGGRPVEVGHHFITKASSSALRYELKNIVPLCNHCHCLIHTQPHLIEPKLCFLMGQEWYDDLMEQRRQLVKTNRMWYETNIEALESMINELTRRQP